MSEPISPLLSPDESSLQPRDDAGQEVLDRPSARDPWQPTSRDWFILSGRARSEVRPLIKSGLFSEPQLHMMLRAQLLRNGQMDDSPCVNNGDSPPDYDEDDTLPRDRHDLPEEVSTRRDWNPARTEDPFLLDGALGSAADPGPLDPVTAPRNRIQCPLFLSESADPVPCSTVMWRDKQLRKQQRLPERPEREDRQTLALRVIQEEGITPCAVAYELARKYLGQFLRSGDQGDPAQGEQAPAQDASADLIQRRQHLLAAALPEGPSPRKQLRFLLESDRLKYSELDDLLAQALAVTDRHWLPCRDDRSRNLWVSPRLSKFFSDAFKENDFDGALKFHDTWLSIRSDRLRCPLQVRAMLGDRTVPCVEALGCAPDPEMMAEEREYGGQEVLWTPEAELPASWSSEEERPGGAQDVVRLLRMRPCHLVGRLLAAELYPLMCELAEQPDESDPRSSVDRDLAEAPELPPE